MNWARWAIIILALLGTALLAGCREDERDRLLSYEPGVYQGKKDTPLSAEALESLRDRGRAQLNAQGVGVPAPAAGGAAPTAATAPPPPAPATGASQPLSHRLQHQSF